jgi:uridine phosphorylase
VQRTRVRVGNVAGNEVVIAEGLKAGDMVVTAGAHQLKDGQKVKLLSDAASPTAPAGSTTVKPDTAKKG